MKKYFPIILSCFCVFICSYIPDIQAQSIHFSQFYNQPLLINPSLTGSDVDEYRVGVAYRSQRFSIPAPYNTVIASFDMPILACKTENGYFGIGGMVYHDASGDGALKESSGALSVAYHQSISDWGLLSIGTQGGYTYKKANFEKLTFAGGIVNFQINPNLPNNNPSISDNFSYFNAKFGLSNIVYLNEKSSFEVGGSYNHAFSSNHTFLTPEAEQNQFTGLWIGHLGGRFGIGEDISINPSIMRMGQADNKLTIAGASLGYHLDSNSMEGDAVYMGTWYRLDDAVVFLLGGKIGNISLSATYDLNVSDLKTATGSQGAIEVSLVYRGLTKGCN